MYYWKSCHGSKTYYFFEIDPPDQHLVADHAPSQEVVDWMVSEGFDPAKLFYKANPKPGVLYTEDEKLAAKMRWKWKCEA
ncbi:MAG: hypothetical protein EOP83_05065 [Verrucomicrobiaceae bacterium]|nr:MAG: hypothetical protein EOP83_05065 [Verrucomicrobiaceae bacterium]